MTINIHKGPEQVLLLDALVRTRMLKVNDWVIG
jgi:hypothetical protein